MIEVTGELWDFYRSPKTVICITTNGYVKARTGEAVMGRGCAREARDKIIGIALDLGLKITMNGNIPLWLDDFHVLSFPVKKNWWEQADLHLIAKSASILEKYASWYPKSTYILPRPGCGNGNRSWDEVKPLLKHLPSNVWVIDRG